MKIQELFKFLPESWKYITKDVKSEKNIDKNDGYIDIKLDKFISGSFSMPVIKIPIKLIKDYLCGDVHAALVINGYKKNLANCFARNTTETYKLDKLDKLYSNNGWIEHNSNEVPCTALVMYVSTISGNIGIGYGKCLDWSTIRAYQIIPPYIPKPDCFKYIGKICKFYTDEEDFKTDNYHNIGILKRIDLCDDGENLFIADGMPWGLPYCKPVSVINDSEFMEKE